MEDTVIVIMSKNKQTGFLEKEIGSYTINENDNLIVNTYAIENNGSYDIHIKISTDKDIEDWEFNAIYDYYDDTNIKSKVISIEEVEDCYNPTWEIVFKFIDSQEIMNEEIKNILHCHKNELLDVYNIIKDKKEEYI